MTPQDLLELQRIAARLADQDNLGTQEVAFHVQRATRTTWQGDPEGSDSSVWVTRDGDPFSPLESQIIQLAHDADQEEVTLAGELYRLQDLELYHQRSGWETVQVFFTREGADRYLEWNLHRLCPFGTPPRIYGESFHRNHEMVTLRRLIPELARLAEKSTHEQT